jgi:glycosyltransferase involved in cell wall biosynthesis
MMGRIGAAVGPALEHAALRATHAVTTATASFRAQLLARFPFLAPERVHAITNGYDRDDFPDVLPTPPPDRFVATYAGTIFRLTSARGLLGAVRRLHEREPALARLLELRFLGRIVDTELGAFEGMERLGVRRIGYVPHDRVIAELAASHLVLCLLDQAPGAERIYPAKIFELMALGRPCLTLAPPGALTDLVARHRLGTVLPPRDEAAIAQDLAARLRAFQDGAPRAEPPPEDVERFDRRQLAGEFAAVFRSASALARSASGG